MDNNRNESDLEMVEDASRLCNEIALADPAKTCGEMDWINKRQVEREVIFGDAPVPTLLRPNFISSSQTKMLISVTDVIMRCLEKVARMYFESDLLHGFLRLNGIEKEMVSIDPGFNMAIVKSRLDAFMSGMNIKFLEFNCDSPAGIGYGEVQGEIFSETPTIKKVREKYDLAWPERMKMMQQALVHCYREFGGKEEKPHIVITDWRDVKTLNEFYLLKNYFEKLGTPTTVLDPRDFELSGDRLIADGKPVDIVYRRVITREVLEKADEVQPFLEACRRKLACVANPFRSKVVSNKSTLAVLTSPEFDKYFTAEENEYKYRHIPWTRNLLSGKVHFDGTESDIFDLAASRKNDFVLKPADGYGGEDVFIGREFTESEWTDAIEKAGGDRVFVLQEYVEIPEEDFPIIHDGDIAIEKRKVNLNPFAIGGKYAGCISRISLHPVINVSAGGGMVPTFSIDRR